MKDNILIESLDPDIANLLTEDSKELDGNGKPKTYYLKGRFIQGDIRNHNGRIYPSSEIRSAVNQINERLAKGFSVTGEIDHPEGMGINLDRVSHMITEMYVKGSDGFGTIKIIETVPSGQLIKGLLDAGVKLGVSSRGAGDVGAGGYVSNFFIKTIDIVSDPSGPTCLPEAIRESKQYKMIDYLASESVFDDRAKLALRDELLNIIKSL